jgi:hypothetical protein
VFVYYISTQLLCVKQRIVRSVTIRHSSPHVAELRELFADWTYTLSDTQRVGVAACEQITK